MSVDPTHGHCDVRIAEAMRRIRSVIARSPVPEDPGHAENTLDWLLRLAPHADAALRLAALAHDIERARPNRLTRDQFPDYDSFKARHAAVGADIANGVLCAAGLDTPLRTTVCHLIRRHETGGDERSDLLKDADSLSYFDHNLAFYFKREGWTNTLDRARWGYRRLSCRARRHYDDIRPVDPVLRKLVDVARREA